MITFMEPSITPPPLMRLSEAPVGSSVTIKQLSGSDDLRHRLREIGVCEEARIHKVSEQNGVVCSVCGVRFALSRDLASGILVEARPEPEPSRGER
jgi:Fe2+ transport system protein FeoA